MSLEALITIYLENCKINLSKKTLKAYKIDLLQFNKIICGKSYLEKENIEYYIGYLKNKSYKTKTIKRKIASIKAFFNFLLYEDFIEINPFHKIKIRLKDSFTLPKIIPLKDLNKLFATIDDRINEVDKSKYVYKELIRDRAILELLLATGMRISELCSLKKINVIYSNNILKIFGKGAKERVLPIFHSKLINDLITYENLFKDDLKNFEYLFIEKIKFQVNRLRIW